VNQRKPTMKQLYRFIRFANFVPFAGVVSASGCVHKAVVLDVTPRSFKQVHRPGRHVDLLINDTNPKTNKTIERARKLTDAAQKYGQRKVRDLAGRRKFVGTTADRAFVPATPARYLVLDGTSSVLTNSRQNIHLMFGTQQGVHERLRTVRDSDLTLANSQLTFILSRLLRNKSCRLTWSVGRSGVIIECRGVR